MALKFSFEQVVCSIFLFLLSFLSLAAFVPSAIATDDQLCDNRYLTLVNPVRGRELWVDKSLKPIRDQYKLVEKNQFAATWLIQFDVLDDDQLVKLLRDFNSDQEIGVFLEISKNFANKSRVIYPYDAAWFSPRAIFLSGYSQSERRRLIDKLFNNFKVKFGYYPKSVGAWWIDSYSLNYLKIKYQIKSVMIVADQKTTDNYGVWGQWWGVPYYPSKANVLTPADSLTNKQEVVILQWAQRDLAKAYGEGPIYSNFSLQANDYIRQGENTNYFQKLVNDYLDCENQLGQITVGLETGMEAIHFQSEYANQLQSLKGIKNLKSVKMSDFADKFASVYQDFPNSISLGSEDSKWLMGLKSRENKKLNDFVKYDQRQAFKDYFVADKSDFLDRNLLNLKSSGQKDFSPWYLIAVLVPGVFAFIKKLLKFWIIGVIFLWACFGLILRSGEEFGWKIFFGPQVPYLVLFQFILVIFSFVLVLLISKIKKFNLIFLPLVFGIDPILQIIRFSFISGKYYFALAIDDLRFMGISFDKKLNFDFFNSDFPDYQAAGLLKLDFVKIWDNLWLAIIIYPLIHILLAIILNFLFGKFPRRVKTVLVFVFGALLVWQISNIFHADPRVVIQVF